MNVELTEREIDRILESIDYSWRAVSAPPDTPPEYKKSDLALLDAIRSKLRSAKASK